MRWNSLWVVEAASEESDGSYEVNLLEVWPTRERARIAKKSLDKIFPEEKHIITRYISPRHEKGLL